MSAAQPLTARQAAILDSIRHSVEERGYPPTLREIGHAVGLISPSSVAYQLGELERMGYLRKDPDRPRALVVVDPGAVPCETCRGTGTVPAGAP
jgi:repressor LexA